MICQYWDHHLLCAKPWHPLFDAREEVITSIPTCIKLPNLALDFWMDFELKAIDEVLGKFITSDVIYKTNNYRLVAQILVALDSRQGLFEFMELVTGDKSYTQPLDYINLFFRCFLSHKVAHILVDCELEFRKNSRGKLG